MLLVLQLLVLLALVACPALHHALHHDSDSPAHHCAATVFAHGQVDASVVAVTAIIPAVNVEFLPLNPVSIPVAPVETSPPGRGPPVRLLAS